MNRTVMYEVSQILDTFNLEEISKLLQSQLQITESSDISIQTIDHFKPLYYKYQNIIKNEDTPEDIKEETTERFTNICNIFLSLLCKKFNFSIDEIWKNDHEKDLPGLVMSLYSFFVLDIASNIQEVCINFIKKNKSYIFEAFEDRKNKKDASTLVVKKKMPIEMAVIIANIYDVTTWILTQLSEEQYILYSNQDYLPLKLISGLLEEGIMGGDFMIEINDMYSSIVSLKGNVCFNIIPILSNENDIK